MTQREERLVDKAIDLIKKLNTKVAELETHLAKVEGALGDWKKAK